MWPRNGAQKGSLDEPSVSLICDDAVTAPKILPVFLAVKTTELLPN